MTMNKMQALCLLASCINLVIAGSAPTVSLGNGHVKGQQCANNDKTSLFQGIPYAQPPVGKLRFMETQPLDNFYGEDDVFDATKQPAPCIQWGSQFDVTMPTPSEDCLYLDIYTPASATPDSRFPVKVWAYGGSNLGSAITYPLFDGCNAATNAIIVSFNYRLGALGFTALDSAGIYGNQAIYDYIEALRWVNKNIASFGGDPDHVMLFGQSSGADDSFTVSSIPEAAKLIKGAVFESGGGFDLTTYEMAQISGRSYAKTLGCGVDDLTCLQTKSVKDLIKAYVDCPALAPGYPNNISVDSSFGVNLPNTTSLNGPNIDNRLIKVQPLKSGPLVPIISGANGEDSSLFTLPPYLKDIKSLTEANYTQFLAQWGSYADAIGKQYPLSKFTAGGLPVPEAILKAITYIMTLTSFTCPAYKSLRAVEQHSVPGYGYIFNHTPSCSWFYFDDKPFPGKYANIFGAAHTAEIPFLFANTKDEPFGNGTCNMTPTEVEISDKMKNAWTALGQSGDPSTSLQNWPQFVNEKKPYGWLVNENVDVARIDYTECQFWNEIFVQMGGVGFDPPSS